VLKALQNKCDLSNRWSDFYDSVVRISGGIEFEFCGHTQKMLSCWS